MVFNLPRKEQSSWERKEILGSNLAQVRGAQDMVTPVHGKLPGKEPRFGGDLQNLEILPATSKKSIHEWQYI